MQAELQDAGAPAGSGGKSESAGARTNRPRSLAAGRALLHALGHDLASCAGRLGLARAELTFRLRRGYARWRRTGETAPRARRVRASASVRVLRAYGIGLAGMILAGTCALAVGMLWVVHDLETVARHDRPSLLLEASDGTPLGRIGPLRGADVTRQELPDHLVQAAVSAEDRRFYSHFGIDPFGIARAAQRNLSAGEIVEGGSTITQQLVKTLYLSSERRLARKLREALAAIWMDLRLTKDEILTRYLNSVYFGSGAYGVGAAARRYFDKQVGQLTLAESAMLVGIIRAPSHYSPLRDAAAARARAAVVLDAMVANGAIDAATAANAKARPAAVHATAASAQSWFADWIAQQADHVTGSAGRSMRIRTTLDPKIQALAEKVVRNTLAAQGARAKASQAALVALRPDGAVIAMVGGRDYRDSQFNRATEAARHAGSAFKVFVYLAALRQGYAPDDRIDAGPLAIGDWRPQNFGGAQYGRVTLADALARSINTAAVRLAMDVGLDAVIRAARDLGIRARLQAVPSLALGAVEVSLLDLTGAFAALRAGRTGLEPWGIAAFGDDAGRSTLHRAGPPVARSAEPLGSAHQPMVEMLRRVVERGTGRGAALEGFAAGKTGTSQEHRDAWFIGFTDALVAGVWVGNDDNSPMRDVVGGTLPAAIWRAFVREATPLLEAEEMPGAFASLATEPEEAACDVEACAARYRSFRSSDCTYQPYSGRRRMCPIAPASHPDASPGHTVDRAAGALAQARCNVPACARRYRSFDAADCSYQPYGGGARQLCAAR